MPHQLPQLIERPCVFRLIRCHRVNRIQPKGRSQIVEAELVLGVGEPHTHQGQQFLLDELANGLPCFDVAADLWTNSDRAARLAILVERRTAMAQKEWLLGVIASHCQLATLVSTIAVCVDVQPLVKNTRQMQNSLDTALRVDARSWPAGEAYVVAVKLTWFAQHVPRPYGQHRLRASACQQRKQMNECHLGVANRGKRFKQHRLL